MTIDESVSSARITTYVVGSYVFAVSKSHESVNHVSFFIAFQHAALESGTPS